MVSAITAGGSIKVRQVDVMAEARWGFGDTGPIWYHREFGSGTHFDPFPAYPHELEVVAETVEVVQREFPLVWDIDLIVADREETSRSNGHSALYEGGHYEGETWVRDPRVGLIVLSGKRIPPHPAMTRYLVAHESGHNVQYMLAVAGGGRNGHDEQLLDEYARLRGLPVPVHHGSGGRWHDSAAEVLACDFRILVCSVETGYWPHPGIAHPFDLKTDLRQWWDKAHELASNWNRSRSADQ